MVMLTVLWSTFFIMMAGFYFSDALRLQALATRLVEEERWRQEERWSTGKTTVDWDIWQQDSPYRRAGAMTENAEAAVEAAFRKHLTDGFYYLRTGEIQVRVTEENSSLQWRGQWVCPLQGWLFFNGGFPLEVKVQAGCREPEAGVRPLHAVLRGIEVMKHGADTTGQ